MTTHKIEIYFPTAHELERAVSNFGQIRHLRDEVDMRVLGHTTCSDGYIILNDMIELERKRLTSLLKSLKTKSG